MRRPDFVPLSIAPDTAWFRFVLSGHILRSSTAAGGPVDILGGSMNKFWALLALPALLLTGCSSGPAVAEPSVSVQQAAPSPSAKPTPTPTATKAATREDQIKELYLENIYDSEPALRAANDGESLVSIGQGFCDMYDGGAKGSDINDFILKGAGWAYTVRQLVSVHGSAVGAYCPEHIEKMSQ